MSDQLVPVMQRPKTRLLLTILIIAIGLALAAFFGIRSVNAFRQLQYIRAQGLDRGAASVDAIRPWMTVRFVAVAYAVPEEYLYAQLGVPFEERDHDVPLWAINDKYHMGQSTTARGPAIIDRMKTAITEYRKNPVATGLRDVRPWMSIRYIANSTGVPEQQIFTAIGMPASGNESKPLDLLSKEQHYRGGPRALVDAVQNALPQPKATP